MWALTWAEVIDGALHRLKFVRQHLDYQPDASQALAYLRATHAKCFPPQVADDRAVPPSEAPTGVAGLVAETESPPDASA